MEHEDVDRVTALIKKVSAGRTILMVEHNMNVIAGISDTITVLQRSEVLAEGSYAEVSKNPLVMEALHGQRRCGAHRSAHMSTTVEARRSLDANGAPALEIAGLQAWYGESHILHGVDLKVNRGEVVTLLGRNGAGRTTTLRAIMGLTGRRTGSIHVGGRETIGLSTHKIAHYGVSHCPEERGIFSSLSCEENLLLPPVIGNPKEAMSLDEIYTMFPNLKERRGSQGTRLSGGEQQMLAVARILRTGANLLLDEISEGLAPVILQTLAHMILMLKQRGYTSWWSSRTFASRRHSQTTSM
ncbi:Branched-chain amino acid transport ATP-binding protein LivF [Candidatus Paraburkholderia calva]|nr:Branched-chain amino acid transport ATP-binding protein LivF [Candidatus Paraburkholderia calva]